MPVGLVNQSALESNFQNPGDIYLDTKTEGAMQVIVDQVNLNAGIFFAGGSALLFSDSIPGLSTNTVFDQIAEIEAQVQAAVGGIVPPGTITTAMIQDGAVTHVKLSSSEQTASVGGLLYANSTLGGW